ncbi:Indigoidine synthase A like protein-domain-containing protein [Amylocarpus encephaloides]|uniref:Indigoidine synthase A like protein-domain-containing protein n=1 Tax=Amylocarpus encephaloides TaxID=45428 RepID=A0A9P8C2J5_9HELO|nr:Indigoidine synthase A like protein-domain-containing protein [Amylocarpus encephaloides]
MFRSSLRKCPSKANCLIRSLDKSSPTVTPFLLSNGAIFQCHYNTSRSGRHDYSRRLETDQEGDVYNERRQPNPELQAYQISRDVGNAMKNRQPIVALETTIYTHGFPYPDNVDLALGLEKIVRDNGAVPATIGVLDGKIRVGMTETQLTRLASCAGYPETMKVSRRDIPYIIGMGMSGRKLNGGTTVSGTMVIAEKFGIKVFGTGGLGGVHRGAQDSMDISADLTELGRTSVAVISSGCKSFLDLPRTLEYLETQGVTVVTFADGRLGEIDIPSFYTRDSGIKSPLVVRSAREAAFMIYASRMACREGNGNGISFANPIPAEFSIPKVEIDAAINQAVQEAADQGFHGHANTPFILSRIKALTEGKSIPANRALIQSNVRMAAKVAVELHQITRNKYIPDANTRSGERAIVRRVKTEGNQAPPENNTVSGIDKVESDNMEAHASPELDYDVPKADIVVFGSLAMDLSCDPGITSTTEPIMKTSNPAIISQTVGGVGHNVALAAQLASSRENVRLCSFVGSDIAGNTLLDALEKEGLDTNGILTVTGQRTAQYIAINDGSKDLVLASADMSIISSASPKPWWILDNTKTAKWAVVDANWSAPEMNNLLANLKGVTNFSGISVAFEPVSVQKSASLFSKSPSTQPLPLFPEPWIDIATPNRDELSAMYQAAKDNTFFESDTWWKLIDSFGIPSSGARDRFVQITNASLTDAGIPTQAIHLLPYIPTILTKLGADGVLLTSILSPDDPRLRDPDHAPFVLSRTSTNSTILGGVYMRLFPAVEEVNDIVSVNGAGDTFLGVLIAGLSRGLKVDHHLIDVAQKGAIMTLRSRDAVSPDLGELERDLDEGLA